MGYPKNKEGLRGLARATYRCTVPIEEIAHPFVPPWVISRRSRRGGSTACANSTALCAKDADFAQRRKAK